MDDSKPNLPPLVNHAYNVRHQILPRLFTSHAGGSVEALKGQLRAMIAQLDQLPDSPKFAAFVKAGRKHGVKLSLNLYVEEPQSEG